MIDHTEKEYAVNKGFVKGVLKLFTRKEILLERGGKLREQYRWNEKNEEYVSEVMTENFGEQEGKTPTSVKEYYEEYGFDGLIEDVSKWIDHEGRTVKEYDLDRLYLGRYIDFLDKARQYLKWFKADQAIARKKIADIRKQQTKSK